MNKRYHFFCRALGYLTYYVIILLIIWFILRNTIKTGNRVVIYSTTLYIQGNLFDVQYKRTVDKLIPQIPFFPSGMSMLK